MITLATWNINSIKARLDTATAWLAANQPDLLLLQEIKCTTDSFPVEAFQALGYHATIHGQPSYNGVAILSKEPVKLVTNSLVEGDPLARFLDIEFRDIRVLNIYAPNGNPVESEKFPYKLNWLNNLYDYSKVLLSQRTPFLISGDFNIIPENIDAKRPENWIHDALFQPQSRSIWKALTYLGLVDAFRALHPNEKNAYSFWDYQAGAWPRDDGIRIDHFLLSPPLADKLDRCWIDKTPRAGEKPSDHTPVLLSLRI